MKPIPHELYCMKDGVSFLVENTLFRIPRYMLENTSPVFRTMLSQVRPDSSDPIALPNVTSADFERLLAFLYPLTPQVDTACDAWDEQQWTAILHLASMWEMSEIRATAMRLLSQIRSPFTKITLGREYGHVPWIKEGFLMLCLRPEPLTAAEAVQLTKEDVIACAAAREEIRMHVLPGEHRWNAPGRVHPSRRIRGKEAGMEYESMPELEHWANNRMVRQIVNHAFGFEEEAEVVVEEGGKTPEMGKDRSIWWPLQEIKSPRILWFTKSHCGGDKGEGDRLSRIISDIKGLSASASVLTVADIEKHWIRGTLQREVLKYCTPLSCSAIALSVGVGFLILVPYALTST